MSERYPNYNDLCNLVARLPAAAYPEVADTLTEITAYYAAREEYENEHREEPETPTENLTQMVRRYKSHE